MAHLAAMVRKHTVIEPTALDSTAVNNADRKILLIRQRCEVNCVEGRVKTNQL